MEERPLVCHILTVGLQLAAQRPFQAMQGVSRLHGASVSGGQVAVAHLGHHRLGGAHQVGRGMGQVVMGRGTGFSLGTPRPVPGGDPLLSSDDQLLTWGTSAGRLPDSKPGLRAAIHELRQTLEHRCDIGLPTTRMVPGAAWTTQDADAETPRPFGPT